MPPVLRPSAGLLSSGGNARIGMGIQQMSTKLKAGSMELEAAFIEWLRTQGYAPADGIDPFFSESEFVRSQMPMIHDSEREQRIEEARQHLKRRSVDPTFAAQFPIVYQCKDVDGQGIRYTVTLTLSDEGAEWVGRAWNGGDYLGDIQGSGSGSHANYLDLARSHIESQIKSAEAARRLKR